MIFISHLIADEQMKELLTFTKAGVESIEFSIAENLDCLDKTMLSYEKRLRLMGCEQLILHGPFLDLNPMSYDSQIRRITMQRYQQCYLAAQKLGAQKIVYHSCFLPRIYLPIGWAERVSEFYLEFLADKDSSIQIVMENVLDPSPELLAEVAQSVRHPAFSLCLDLGHAHCYSSVPLSEWISCLFSFITHLHLHDNCGQADSHLALGKGNIPFTQLLPDLLSKNPTVSLECSSQKDLLSGWKLIRNLQKGQSSD